MKNLSTKIALAFALIINISLSSFASSAMTGQVKLRGKNQKISVTESQIILNGSVFEVTSDSSEAVEASRKEKGKTVESIVLIIEAETVKQVLMNPSEYFAFDPESKKNHTCSAASNAVIIISDNIKNIVSGNCLTLK